MQVVVRMRGTSLHALQFWNAEAMHRSLALLMNKSPPRLRAPLSSRHNADKPRSALTKSAAKSWLPAPVETCHQTGDNFAASSPHEPLKTVTNLVTNHQMMRSIVTDTLAFSLL